MMIPLDINMLVLAPLPLIGCASFGKTDWSTFRKSVCPCDSSTCLQATGTRVLRGSQQCRRDHEIMEGTSFSPNLSANQPSIEKLTIIGLQQSGAILTDCSCQLAQLANSLANSLSRLGQARLAQHHLHLYQVGRWTTAGTRSKRGCFELELPRGGGVSISGCWRADGRTSPT